MKPKGPISFCPTLGATVAPVWIRPVVPQIVTTCAEPSIPSNAPVPPMIVAGYGGGRERGPLLFENSIEKSKAVPA